MTARTSRRCHTLLLVLGATLAAAIVAGPGSALAATGWTWPVSGEVITPYRNGADPYAAGQHRGIDVAAPSGAPVAAAVTGSVGFAGIAGSSGLTVSVRTADGRFDTSYLHLSSADVREGDAVRAGERIGAVGTSGRRSATAPHLHFGVREADSRYAYRNPLDFLPVPGTPQVRERPRVPVGAPVPIRPLPDPVRVPSRARSRRRVPARRVRVPAARRIRVPAGGRRSLPRLHPAPLPGPVPVTGLDRAPRPVPHAGRVPSRGPAPATEPRADGLGEPLPTEPSPAPRTSPQPGRGPDLGWALACAGLLLAAACLGRPSGRGAPGGSGGARRARREPQSRATPFRRRARAPAARPAWASGGPSPSSRDPA